MLIDVFPPNLCDYEFIMIVHVILCLNEREIQKKKEKRKIRSRGSDVKIDFQFSWGSINLNSFENELTVFTKKITKKKERKKREKRKIEVKRGERK